MKQVSPVDVILAVVGEVVVDNVLDVLDTIDREEQAGQWMGRSRRYKNRRERTL
jgi:hypothetical protein